MPEVIFLCDRYPEYGITVKPFGIKDANNNMKKAVHLQFRLNPVLVVGELRVKDEELIEKVRNDEFFKCGKIVEVSAADYAKMAPKAPKLPKVKAGVHSSADVRMPSGAPESKPRPVKGARVPGKK